MSKPSATRIGSMCAHVCTASSPFFFFFLFPPPISLPLSFFPNLLPSSTFTTFPLPPMDHRQYEFADATGLRSKQLAEIVDEYPRQAIDKRPGTWLDASRPTRCMTQVALTRLRNYALVCAASIRRDRLSRLDTRIGLSYALQTGPAQSFRVRLCMMSICDTIDLADCSAGVACRYPQDVALAKAQLPT
jgi:hypothetical protein